MSVKGRKPINIKAFSELRATLIKKDGTKIDKGVIGRKCITTVFVDLLVDNMAAGASNTINTFKYHGSGTSTAEPAITDTAMITPCYDTGDGVVHSLGDQSEAAHNIYQSACTISYTTTAAITEHGLFNQSTVSGAKLADRTKFTAINVVSGDAIRFTYQLTFTAGG